MSNYTKATNFATKDSLASGNPLKIVKGTELNTEFDNIATAVATKADLASPTFTGTPSLPTGTTGVTQSATDDSTKIATTAFVQDAIAENATSVSISGGSITGITDLAVADGGTGSSSLTANAVLLGNGTSAIQTVAPSTSGNVLTSNGTTWTSATPSPGVPSGAVMAFAMSTAPTGWLEANGAAVSRTTYADLFSAIGTTYGSGDGSTTFNLPDLRGEFIRGWDHGKGTDSGRAIGSSQTGTATLTAGSSPFCVTISQNTENTYYVSSDAGGWASYHTTTGAFGYVRPRNIAMMYCVKT